MFPAVVNGAHSAVSTCLKMECTSPSNVSDGIGNRSTQMRSPAETSTTETSQLLLTPASPDIADKCRPTDCPGHGNIWSGLTFEAATRYSHFRQVTAAHAGAGEMNLLHIDGATDVGSQTQTGATEVVRIPNRQSEPSTSKRQSKKARKKRRDIQAMVRPLKCWLVRHRHNPYPTRQQKQLLGHCTDMNVAQVSTWFANARRRLKQAVKEEHAPWPERIRRYNSCISENAELLSLASDDSIWNDPAAKDDVRDTSARNDANIPGYHSPLMVPEVSRSTTMRDSRLEDTGNVAVGPASLGGVIEPPHSGRHVGNYKRRMLLRYLSDARRFCSTEMYNSNVSGSDSDPSNTGTAGDEHYRDSSRSTQAFRDDTSGARCTFSVIDKREQSDIESQHECKLKYTRKTESVDRKIDSLEQASKCSQPKESLTLLQNLVAGSSGFPGIRLSSTTDIGSSSNSRAMKHKKRSAACKRNIPEEYQTHYTDGPHMPGKPNSQMMSTVSLSRTETKSALLPTSGADEMNGYGEISCIQHPLIHRSTPATTFSQPLLVSQYNWQQLAAGMYFPWSTQWREIMHPWPREGDVTSPASWWTPSNLQQYFTNSASLFATSPARFVQQSTPEICHSMNAVSTNPSSEHEHKQLLPCAAVSSVDL